MKKKCKFVIVSPRQMSGGPIVLHTLCKQLAEMGYDSSIFYSHVKNYRKGHKIQFWIKHFIFTLKDLYKTSMVRLLGEKKFIHNSGFKGYVNVTVKGCKRRFWPFVDKNTIVVYPEIIYGNFMNAQKVVRYLLYYNDYQNENDYGENDLFICYREEFNDEKLNPQKRKVKCPYFNLNLYKRENYGQRSGNCYIVRKGKDRPDLPKEFDGPVLDNLPEIDKVAAFNQYEYCIIYDTQTAYSGIAAMCGCISVMIPESGKDADYYRKDNPRYGIAIGFAPDEIAFAKNTQHLILERYEKLNKECKENVKMFIDICEEYFRE